MAQRKLFWGGGALAIVVPLAAQTAPLEKPADRDQAFRQMQLGSSEKRQSNWADDSAQVAGGTIAPQSPAVEISPAMPVIRKYIAAFTDATLSPGGLQKAAEMLGKSDRERLAAEVSPPQSKRYDDLVEQFRTQFKARYGEEFSLSNHDTALTEYRVLSGVHAPDEAMVVAFAATTAPATRPAQGDQSSATLVIPPNAGLNQPAMALAFNQEQRNTWKLRAAPGLSPHRVQANLEARLRKMLEGQTNWPADPREAYRAVNYCVLAAFADQPLEPAPQPATPAKSLDPDNPSLES